MPLAINKTVHLNYAHIRTILTYCLDLRNKILLIYSAFLAAFFRARRLLYKAVM
jgi:hypothetical protein